jgi:hypothetical protein
MICCLDDHDCKELKAQPNRRSSAITSRTVALAVASSSKDGHLPVAASPAQAVAEHVFGTALSVASKRIKTAACRPQPSNNLFDVTSELYLESYLLKVKNDNDYTITDLQTTGAGTVFYTAFIMPGKSNPLLGLLECV